MKYYLEKKIKKIFKEKRLYLAIFLKRYIIYSNSQFPRKENSNTQI